jgi:hypothetical protein
MDPSSQGGSRLAAPSQRPDEGVVSPTNTSNGPTPFRAITHLAVLTAFILPITVLPYVLTRRRLSSLHRQIDSMGTTMKILQQDLSRATSVVATHKEDTRRMKALLHRMMQEADQSRLRANKREAEQAASGETVRSDLRMLLNERQHTRLVQYHIGNGPDHRYIFSRRTQGATLRSLGTSLADVAAFMHEVELEMGMVSQGTDQRGVNRLRLLAFRMTSPPRQDGVIV